MSEASHDEQDAAPAGERIHMPAPSLLPLLNAIGLALAIVSITLTPILLIAGLVLFGVTAAIWIRDSVRETKHLPLEHE